MCSRIFTTLCLAVLTQLTVGCSKGGDSATDVNDGPVGGWVTITYPNDTGQASTYCNDVTLSGEAFVSADYYHCCSGNASDAGVTVSWENLVTGDSDIASQRVSYCYLFGTPYICEHTWSATIPLILGDNILRVTAVDPGGTGDTDTITVTKPEYSYSASGLVSTYDGSGVGYYQAEVELLLTGKIESRVVPSSAGDYIGEYSFSCLPNGAYSVEPTTTAFNYAFQPGFIDFTISGQDVTNLDFQTEAYPLSGRLTSSSGVPIHYFMAVEISDANEAVLVSNIADDGTYSFMVPAGTYTLKVIDLLCDTCGFTPEQRTVDVTNSGITGLDFSKLN